METPTETPEFIAQAVKYYRAVLENKKKAWRSKHPNARRGRPRKVPVETNEEVPDEVPEVPDEMMVTYVWGLDVELPTILSINGVEVSNK